MTNADKHAIECIGCKMELPRRRSVTVTIDGQKKTLRMSEKLYQQLIQLAKKDTGWRNLCTNESRLAAQVDEPAVAATQNLVKDAT